MGKSISKLLSIRNLGLSFSGVTALEGVSLDISTGQILSIIGPNGAGKTCLLNCTSGHYHSQKGSIKLRERELRGLRPDQIARLGIGRTFQDPTTFPNMKGIEVLMTACQTRSKANIIENLLFVGRNLREELENRQRVEDIISLARIEEVRQMPLAAMTYGQRKQVDIARVMVMNPELVLLDEPMSGLDEFMKEVVTDLIMLMHHKGITVVLIEHDMEVVMDLSDFIVVLDHGKKIAEGTANEISRDQRVAEAYLGIRPPQEESGDNS